MYIHNIRIILIIILIILTVYIHNILAHVKITDRIFVKQKEKCPEKFEPL